MSPQKLLYFFLVVMASTFCLASVRRAEHDHPGTRGITLADRQQQLWKWPAHDSEFALVPHLAAHPSCEATQPPEALATPDPLLVRPDADMKVTVSFIVGTDGRVHSPLILESTRPWEEKTVLKTVSSWRFRPATCNGVPTDAEGKIEFSSRVTGF